MADDDYSILGPLFAPSKPMSASTQRRLGASFLEQGMSAQPRNWAEGLNKGIQTALGFKMMLDADRLTQSADKAAAGMFGLGGNQPAPAPQTAGQSVVTTPPAAPPTSTIGAAPSGQSPLGSILGFDPTNPLGFLGSIFGPAKASQ